MIDIRPHCDITRVEVEAIVNAANSALSGGGGVDGAIHRAAGPELLQATRKLGRCPTGEARLTAGYQLPARWVIHAVGPVWHGGHKGEAELLARTYASAFELAIREGVSSIAFPAISTGAYRFPKREAARVAARSMRQYEKDFELIIACCRGSDADLYAAALSETD